MGPVITERLDVHVLPVNDLRAHVERRDCWCQPVIEPQRHGTLVIHHAADGRDLIEAHGIH